MAYLPSSACNFRPGELWTRRPGINIIYQSVGTHRCGYRVIWWTGARNFCVRLVLSFHTTTALLFHFVDNICLSIRAGCSAYMSSLPIYPIFSRPYLPFSLPDHEKATSCLALERGKTGMRARRVLLYVFGFIVRRFGGGGPWCTERKEALYDSLGVRRCLCVL